VKNRWLDLEYNKEYGTSARRRGRERRFVRQSWDEGLSCRDSKMRREGKKRERRGR
jgi:hypothetical protein